MLAEDMIASREQVETEYEQTVRHDIEVFRTYANKFTAGQLSDDDFRAQRLRRGVYTQRQAGVHMIRTKVPGGTATADQMDQLALASELYASGKAHLTTRQNVQYHFVTLP